MPKAAIQPVMCSAVAQHIGRVPHSTLPATPQAMNRQAADSQQQTVWISCRILRALRFSAALRSLAASRRLMVSTSQQDSSTICVAPSVFTRWIASRSAWRSVGVASATR